MATETPAHHTASTAKKRSIARRFNDALSARAVKKASIDLRSARKLERYRRELETGESAGKPLSPIEVALRVNTLLDAGDGLGEINKISRWRPVEQYDEESTVAVLREMHTSYGFRPEAYRFVGIRYETLLAAGVIEKIPARRGRKKVVAP